MKKQEYDPKLLAEVEKATLEAVQRQGFGNKPLDLKKIAKELLEKNGDNTRPKKRG
tara:strand:+ start:128 stop:295 length:168 start_codon:yes stop_codon:yes gene_type:complete